MNTASDFQGFPRATPACVLALGPHVPVPAALHLPAAVEYCAGAYEKIAPLMNWLAPVL